MLNEDKINSVLIRASRDGHSETVKALLDAGADVHAAGDYALRWAGENGHTETVKLLLDAGADVHADNYIALRWASRNGHTETVKVLREAMASTPKLEAVSSLQAGFKAKAGIDLTPEQAVAAFRIVRELDGAKAPAP